MALLRFAWQAWHFVTFRRFCNVPKMVLCGRRNTFQRFQKMRCSFRGWRSTLDVSCCVVFYANRIVRAVSGGDKVQISWYAWHFVRCDEN